MRTRPPGARRPNRPPPGVGPARSPPGAAPFDPFSYSRRAAREARFGPLVLGGERTVAVELPLASPLGAREAIRAEIDAHAGPRVPIETRADLVEVRVLSEEELGPLATLHEAMKLLAPGLALSARFEPALAARLLRGLAGGAPLPAGFRPGLADRMVLPVGGPASRRRRGLRADRSPPGRCRGGSAAGSSSKGPRKRSSACSADRPEPSAGVAGPGPGLAVAIAAPGADLAGFRRACALGGGRRRGRRRRQHAVHEHRRLAAGLRELGIELPIVLTWDIAARGGDALLAPALALGSLLCDGIGDAVSIRASDPSAARPLAFNILQAARVRISKTEFISCPSCGRTLFDLEETTRRIKSRTAHLKGLKIAIMGCVVNGPGEMADADFGYVGWGAGKIALFVGKELVARDIPTEEADDRLVELIRAHGKWQDPAPEAETPSLIRPALRSGLIAARANQPRTRQAPRSFRPPASHFRTGGAAGRPSCQGWVSKCQWTSTCGPL